jgi:hypothetical protein
MLKIFTDVEFSLSIFDTENFLWLFYSKNENEFKFEAFGK